jgi:hypothetical protein
MREDIAASSDFFVVPGVIDKGSCFLFINFSGRTVSHSPPGTLPPKLGRLRLVARCSLPGTTIWQRGLAPLVCVLASA